jgi:preprotein translocase subunit SecE
MDNAPGMDPKRLVLIFFVVAALALAVFLERLLGFTFSALRIADPAIFGGDWTLSTVIGYGVALVAAVITWRSAKIQRLGLEVAGELKKVTWPSMRETRAATVAVVVATFIAAVILGAFDFVWARLSSLVY